MKRIRLFDIILCFLLLVAVTVPVLPAAKAKTTGTYTVAVQKTAGLSDAAADASVLFELHKGKVVEVTEVRLGYGKVFVNAVSLEGWVNMNDLKSLQDGYTDDHIVRIEIVNPPSKQTYIVGEESFDRSGLVVCAVYDNNDRIEIDKYVLYEPSLNTVGKKNIIVLYRSPVSGKEFSETFPITVVQVPIDRISIEGNVQTEFAEGQSLSFEGMTVRVSYSDGRPDRLFTWADMQNNKDFVIRVNGKEVSDEPLQIGTYTVEIYYMYAENVQSYNVSVVPAEPQELQIVSLPDRNYFFSDSRTLDLTGLVLNLVYNNGKKETIGHRDCEVVFDAQNAVIGENEIILRYKGCQTSIIMEMREAGMVGIEVTDPGKTVYIQGALFDANDTLVSGIYESGEKMEIIGWEVHGFDTSTCGKKTVEVRYGDFSVSFDVYVTISGYFGGDVNLDGEITPSDARMILRHSVELEKLSGTAAVVADRNEDEQITVADARLTLRAAVGLDPLFMDFSKTK